MQEARHLVTEPNSLSNIRILEKLCCFLVNLMWTFQGKIICHRRCNNQDAFDYKEQKYQLIVLKVKAINFLVQREVWRQWFKDPQHDFSPHAPKSCSCSKHHIFTPQHSNKKRKWGKKFPPLLQENYFLEVPPLPSCHISVRTVSCINS